MNAISYLFEQYIILFAPKGNEILFGEGFFIEILYEIAVQKNS
jgi:hypothetical protein